MEFHRDGMGGEARMTAQEWKAKIESSSYNLSVDLEAFQHFEYWKQIRAPLTTMVVLYPIVDFGSGQYRCFQSHEEFVEFLEAPETLTCGCGICKRIAKLRGKEHD